MDEFIDFESNDVDNNPDDYKVSSFTVDESSLDSFIDDASSNLEYTVDDADDNSLVHETRSVESTLEEDFSENDDKIVKSDNEIYNYYDSDEVTQLIKPEKIEEFKDAKLKISQKSIKYAAK